MILPDCDSSSATSSTIGDGGSPRAYYGSQGHAGMFAPGTVGALEESAASGSGLFSFGAPVKTSRGGELLALLAVGAIVYYANRK